MLFGRDSTTSFYFIQCLADVLDTLLMTLIPQLQSADGDKSEAKAVAKRFVRSVTRVFVVFNIEMSPGQSRKKALQSATQPLQRCKRVFQVSLRSCLIKLLTFENNVGK
jgi:E3 ubiquitin-protein ligase EDD1